MIMSLIGVGELLFIVIRSFFKILSDLLLGPLLPDINQYQEILKKLSAKVTVLTVACTELC